MRELGIIEGYFGRAWSWAERADVVRSLAPDGYAFFHYAPKIEAKLRKRWADPFTPAEMDDLANFADVCRALDVRFGVGLTPFGVHLDFNADAKIALKAKCAQLDAIGIDDLAILFDDMEGKLPDLAQRQADIIAFITDVSAATRYFTCPSYYSDDPVLDRVFGQRPDAYLEDFGRLTDPAIAVYWTGEEVCSAEYSAGHLEDVAQRLGRKPALWDNYPVNDGPRMSQYLHLRAFTGRGGVERNISHHAINPASQPILSCIPAKTLPMVAQQGASYAYGAALADAARAVCGPDLADMLVADLLTFNDAGLDRMSDARKAALIEKYASIDHAAAREIVDWLQGGFAITGEMLQTQ